MEHVIADVAHNRRLDNRKASNPISIPLEPRKLADYLAESAGHGPEHS